MGEFCIIASSRNFYTLPVCLNFFRSEATTEWEKIMTGASLATVPLLIAEQDIDAKFDAIVEELLVERRWLYEQLAKGPDA
jgi:hypothetical protein